MAMPGRKFNNSAYRYGMNGQEKDEEVFDGAMTADYWEYDTRTGRRWETDPISYPWQSPYACFNNNPIFFADPNGLEGEGPNGECPGDKKVLTASNGSKGNFEYVDNKIGWIGTGIGNVNLDEVKITPMPGFIEEPLQNDHYIASKGIDFFAPKLDVQPFMAEQWEKDFAKWNYEEEMKHWNSMSYEDKWQKTYEKLMMDALADFAQKEAAPVAELYTIQAYLGGSGYNAGPSFISFTPKVAVARLEMTIIERAEIGVGNFGLGSGSHSESIGAGIVWVGPGYRVASDGKTLISANGLRQFRPPSAKPRLKISQANFESRATAKGSWKSNGHLNIE